jgi:hypothetical protein
MTDNIYTAVNKIMAEVGYVKKQRGANLNYTYAGEAALISALRPEMVENGIFCHVAEIRDIVTREYTTGNGKAMVNVTLQGTVRFYHAPSGTYIDVVSCGEGSDTGDKATNKAMTGMYKYALRQTFCIETGDDPDKERSQERQPARQDAAPQPPATTGNPQPATTTRQTTGNGNGKTNGASKQTPAPEPPPPDEMGEPPAPDIDDASKVSMAIANDLAFEKSLPVGTILKTLRWSKAKFEGKDMAYVKAWIDIYGKCRNSGMVQAAAADEADKEAAHPVDAPLA